MVKINKHKLLIVDDEELLCESLHDIFQEKGFDVITANNGHEAIHKAKHLAFNIAFIDIKLPDMDGITLLRELKKKYPESIYIIITAHATRQNAISALKAGADGYFLKPIVIEELETKIYELLEK